MPGTSCQTYPGDMEREMNSPEDRSGLEDKCCPPLHPWGWAAWSPLCSRSQHRRDQREQPARERHSTTLQQGAEGTPLFGTHVPLATWQHDCHRALDIQYCHSPEPMEAMVNRRQWWSSGQSTGLEQSKGSGKVKNQDLALPYLECRE